ncbi:HU family DNA-binding protein [Candidatus Nanohalovita haloferacivicina]|nr:HU family DNA-binding protein [Candidatus Nanohalobia archaeon BNXNv]
MKKLAILLVLLATATGMALANPVYEARGNMQSNALYQGIDSGDCDDADRCVRLGKVALTVQTWVDPDSDGDGILDLTDTEVISTNRGQVTAAVTSEKRPKFKAGAELSKNVNSMYVGDLDGDGFGDVAVGIRKEVQEKKNSYRVSGTSIEDWRLPAKVEAMNKAELIEAIASESGLSKADSKKALDSITGEIILGEDR